MSELLDTAIFPMAFFVKITPVTRTTLENWMRSGVLSPAQEGESTEGPLGVFGGKKFSIRNLFKVETMFRLSRFGIGPSSASNLADRAIQDFEVAADEIYRTYKDEELLLDPDAHRVSYSHKVDDELSLNDVAPVAIIIPIGAIAKICFAKLDVFMTWAEVEFPKLREHIIAHASKFSGQ